MFRNAIILGAIVSMLVVYSCQEDDIDIGVSVFTDEVVFASGERAIFSGRVLGQGAVNVSDHGFELAQDDSFSNPEIISLGEKNVPGRFVGETASLNIKLNYFFRSFIVTEGNTIYGNVLEFTTLGPRIVDYYPKEGVQGNQITVEGRNFTSQTKVFWNGEEVTPITIVEETLIEFKVPAVGSTPFGIITVEVETESFEYEIPFEYITGKWSDEIPLNFNNSNKGHVYFENDTEFIYGTGIDIMFNGPSTRFHFVDKETLEETETLYPGSKIEGAFYNSTYFGSGSFTQVRTIDEELALARDLWKYENGDFIKLQNIPKALFNAVALKVGDNLYVYGGEDVNRNESKTIQVYNTVNDEWSNLNDAPVWFHVFYPAFSIDNYNYFITPNGQMHKHNLDTDTWERAADYPEEVKTNGISLDFNGKGYVGLQDISRRIFEYSPDEDMWRSKTSLNTLDQFQTKGVWIHDDQFWIMRTNLGSGAIRRVWTFDPTAF